MEPILPRIFRAVEEFLSEGRVGFRGALEALSSLALIDWMRTHPGITLGAGAVVVWAIVAAAKNKSG